MAPSAGGSVSAYYWTFGDGRTTNATGPDVTHVYSEAGTYTASVTVTSSSGTIIDAHQERHRPRRLVRGRGGALQFRVVRDDAG